MENISNQSNKSLGRSLILNQSKTSIATSSDNEVEDLTIQRYILQLKQSLAVFEREKDRVTTLEEPNSLLTIGNLGEVVINDKQYTTNRLDNFSNFNSC